MKNLSMLVACGLLASAANLQAETYTGQTTPIPDGALWTNPNTAPGVYSELTGTYMLDLRNVYYMIANYSNYLDSEALVVNEENEIVYQGKISFAASGGRYFNCFGLTIPEEDKITEPGTYHIIYPSSSGWDVTNQAFIDRNTTEEIYNLKAGPYIVGELKDPVDALITVEPQGDFDVNTLPQYVTLSVSNADMFNCQDIDGMITVKDAEGTVLEMEPGTKEGTTLKWEFPYDGATGTTAVIPKGTYTITIDYSNISAYTSELNPLLFPATPQEYVFNMEGGTLQMTPQVTISPEAGRYDTWTAGGITFNFVDATFKDVATCKEAKLNIVKPSNEVVELSVFRPSVRVVGFKTPAEDEIFSEDGTYTCILKIDGLPGTRTSDSEEVIFNNVTFEYVIGSEKPEPVNAEYTVSPQGEFISSELPEGITLSVSNALSLAIAADSAPLSVKNTVSGEEVSLLEPVVGENSIVWPFAETWNREAGEYSVTLSFASITGTAENEAELLFPEENSVTSFIVMEESKVPEVDLVASFAPEAGTYKEWTAEKIEVTWKDLCDYKLDKAGRDEYLNRVTTIVGPDGTVTEIKLDKATDAAHGKINFFLINVIVPEGTFANDGEYTVTFPVKGLSGVQISTNEPIVVANDLTVTYKIDSEVSVSEIGQVEGESRYYNLQGNKVEDPTVPGLYIKVESTGKATRVLVK